MSDADRADIERIRTAILEDAPAEEFASLTIPGSYRAVTVHKDEASMFDGMPSRDKDPRQSIHVEEVPLPPLAAGEALIAVMASSINYNTVWTSIFEPVSTFGFLERYWGFEKNFGGLAELAIVKSNQLMPKPAHLTWEEAASPGLVNSTAYRQLVSRNGAGMKQGDVILIWGASGGLGSYATQYALNGGAIPVCVVSSPEKADLVRAMGADLVIDRSAEGYRFWKDEQTQDPKEWQRLGKKIRELTGGDDPDIVFEHPGRETFGASVYVARKGGTIVTCASTSGFMHEYDNRYLWMNLKRIIGSHFANYREAHEANRLIARGMIHPTVSQCFPLEEAGEAAYQVHRNFHQGKVGVLALAPSEGLGVSDPAFRALHVDEINRFRES